MRIQGTTTSTRDVVSERLCGQFGPVLSTDVRRGAAPGGVVKYGAPES